MEVPEAASGEIAVLAAVTRSASLFDGGINKRTEHGRQTLSAIATRLIEGVLAEYTEMAGIQPAIQILFLRSCPQLWRVI